eukprot:CAMPEP_0169092538 /NCGR_PEP_ID=MMETSP1015-20121227/16957_1 /TAXON_ID=342587 /ORGANISM="Karlodinium micrum, Strain CCMP2283" /LENGTH=338 /DNA_ID=CAMNT_0009153119 /DNA_START=201 /DNA_END=1217 /DNA_ORIENTATION=+
MYLTQLLFVPFLLATESPVRDETCSLGSELGNHARETGIAGVALLSARWRRSVVKSDETNAEEQPISAQTASNDSIPCGSDGCANRSMTKAAQSSRNMSTASTKTLLHQPLSNNFASGWSGQEGYLSSAESILPEILTDANVSSPPLSQEHFDPFGYPGAGLLLELRLPQITLKELHNSWRSSLAQFLLAVQTEISKAGEVKESRISILGILGRYKRYDNDVLLRVQSQSMGHIPGQSHVDEEVMVRFEILPGWNEDPDPSVVLSSIRNEMNSSSSALMQGDLGPYLGNATVVIGPQVGLASAPLAVEHHSVVRMSAMAWPIGISAAFIGVLICVASY